MGSRPGTPVTLIWSVFSGPLTFRRTLQRESSWQVTARKPAEVPGPDRDRLPVAGHRLILHASSGRRHLPDPAFPVVTCSIGSLGSAGDLETFAAVVDLWSSTGPSVRPAVGLSASLLCRHPLPAARPARVWKSKEARKSPQNRSDRQLFGLAGLDSSGWSYGTAYRRRCALRLLKDWIAQRATAVGMAASISVVFALCAFACAAQLE